MPRYFRTDAQLRGDKYPLRRVESREPQNPGRDDAYSRERLECGHELPHMTGKAQRRRCYECAMEERGLSSVSGLIVAVDREIEEERRRKR